MASLKLNVENATADVGAAIKEKRIWLALGWNDVRSRYHRSKLGVLWASMSMLILVGALSPIYSSLMGVALGEYVLHLLLGFVVWNYVSGIMMESGREFINSANYLVSFQLSYFTLLFRVVWRNLIVFGYQMIVFVIAAFIFQPEFSIAWAITPLAILLITVNALWMGLAISVVATRFRDIDELVNNILRLVFFVTPIMWMPDFKKDLQFIADINPFYHLIEIFREPFVSGTISLHSWNVALVMPLFGCTLAFLIFARYRSRIAFWL